MDSSGRIIHKIIKGQHYFDNAGINDLSEIQNKNTTLTIETKELIVETQLNMDNNRIINAPDITELNRKVGTLQRQVNDLLNVINILTGKNLS